jgi:DUF1365 family protein
VNSAIYTGTVSHARYQPREHRFDYRLFMLYLDLAELPQLFDQYWFWSARRPNLAWFRRSDFFGDHYARTLADWQGPGVAYESNYAEITEFNNLVQWREWMMGRR